MHFFHVKSHQTESSSLASEDLQRKGVISLNYCSQFDEILHEKSAFQDLLKTFFRINLSLLEAELCSHLIPHLRRIILYFQPPPPHSPQ